MPPHSHPPLSHRYPCSLSRTECSHSFPRDLSHMTCATTHSVLTQSVLTHSHHSLPPLISLPAHSLTLTLLTHSRVFSLTHTHPYTHITSLSLITHTECSHMHSHTPSHSHSLTPKCYHTHTHLVSYYHQVSCPQRTCFLTHVIPVCSLTHTLTLMSSLYLPTPSHPHQTLCSQLSPNSLPTPPHTLSPTPSPSPHHPQTFSPHHVSHHIIITHHLNFYNHPQQSLLHALLNHFHPSLSPKSHFPINWNTHNDKSRTP